MNTQETTKTAETSQEADMNTEHLLANSGVLKSIETYTLAALSNIATNHDDLSNEQKDRIEEKLISQVKVFYDCSDEVADEIAETIIGGAFLQMLAGRPTDIFVAQCFELINKEGLVPVFYAELCMVAKHG